jgi:glycosyltransferase involved in cell wall biosynthesis
MSEISNSNQQVTVVMPTYNGKSRGFICKAIDSVLNQTVEISQLIIIDDGSQDGTADFLRERYSEAEIYTKINGGPSSARNYSFQYIKSPFVCFLDDDDEWLPSKTADQLKYFEDNKETDLLMSGMTYINKNSVPGKSVFPGNFGLTYPESLLGNCYLPPSTIMFRKSLLDKVGDFNINYRLGEDYEYYIRCTQHGVTNILDKVTTLYRVHDSQSCLDLQKIDEGNLTVITDYTRANNPTYETAIRQYFCTGCACRAIIRREFKYAIHMLSESGASFKPIYLALRMCGILLSPLPKIKQKWRLSEYNRIFANLT